MEWMPAEPKEDHTYKIPERWLHLYYYEALNILFRFENALRIFVYVILKRHLGSNWDLAALGDDTTIRTETKKRLAQTREHGYLGYDVSSPMLFLNGGELTQLIVSEPYWKHFAQFFKASKAIVITKLQEIGTVRNSLAHFRPIKQDDVDLIKQNSRHLLIAIEDCLVQITSISDVVPTNSEEAWYKELKPIGNDHLTTSLFSSRDQQWIRLQLSYSVPILKKYVSSPKYPSYRLGSLRVSQLLRRYASLRENCIYLSEAMSYPRMGEDLNPIITRQISIVFSKSTLDANLQVLSDALKNIALTVETETDLTNQDSLARGELIEAKTVTAVLRETGGSNTYWSFNLETMNTAVTEIDDVEYWGQRGHFATDFISSTSHYPWMPSSVSDVEIPF
jgi:HEPN superfamily Swt1-like protein